MTPQEQVVKGLIIDQPWIGMILSGSKTWEMRSRNTAVRGRIALIRKGSKAVVGVADLVGIVPKMSQSDPRRILTDIASPRATSPTVSNIDRLGTRARSTVA